MKLAVLIICHKNSFQVNRLIDSLSDERIDIYVLVDKKSCIKDEIKTKDNVYILPDKLRVDIRWATYSQIQAILNILTFSNERKKYDYYLLISGQDYPLVSTCNIISKLESNPNVNYINICSSKNSLLRKRTRFDKRNEIYMPDWLLGRGFIIKVFRRLWIIITGGYNRTFYLFNRNKKNYPFYYGSSWWCLNKRFVEYCLKFLKNNNEYIRMFHKSICPDESFFQSLFMNSDFKNNRDDNLHYIDWTAGDSSPKILTTIDIEKAIRSGKLFARKIDLDVDKEIIDVIEKTRQKS